MLRIGKLTDYAILILSEMAKSPDSLLSASSLAEALHLTPPTVSKVLKILAENGLVTSVRGAVGGYRLARKAATISLTDVITAMEGAIALTECCDDNTLCSINAMCTMRDNWRKINHKVADMLAEYTIVDMLSPINMEVAHVE